MKIIILIPAYNEAKKIFNVVHGVIDSGYEVVVVDDGSTDATVAEARRAGAWVLRHFVNRGYGAALTTGMAWALSYNYDMAVHFDADGQHEVGDIGKLIKPIIENQMDVVLGSRFISDAPARGWSAFGRNDARQPEAGRPLAEMTRMKIPFVRKILIKFAILFTWLFSGVKLTDAHNGLRAFSRRALDKIDCHQDGMSYASEVVDQIAEHGLRYSEVPVTVKYTDYSRTKGESNVKKILLGVRFLWEKLLKS